MMPFAIVKEDNKILVHELLGNGVAASEERIPHEWYFICILLHKEMKRDPKTAREFEDFTWEFYPDYRWHFRGIDSYANVTAEAAFHDIDFRIKYEDGVEPEGDWSDSKVFGGMATDFLIRCRNYSLVDFSGTKMILTAQSDCEKRFYDYLKDGYQLHKIAKLQYKDGVFTRLPVFPTRDIGFPINEVIEGSDGSPNRIIEPHIRTRKNTDN